MAVGKKITDLPASGSLKDTNLAIVHDGNGTKKSTLIQISEYLGTKFSNPNLLTNPDFKINQRRLQEYAYQTFGSNHYTVDRFRVVYLNVKTASNGLVLNANGTNEEGGYLGQVLENVVKGDTILSFKVSSVAGTIGFKNIDNEDTESEVIVSSDGVYTVKGNNTKKIVIHLTKGSSCKIEWIKLEQGSIATPFVAPNPAEELVKCRRYYIFIVAHFYGVANPNGFINEDLTLFRNFRIDPTTGIRATYSSGVTESTLTLKGTNINGFYLYGRTRTSGDYALDVTITADAEIY